ncbi:MAG: caspase family protein [Tissierellales bacterium]|nr:caspase family protein [Tissierellales bacterium]
MKRVYIFALLITILIPSLSFSERGITTQPRRIALVIGNSAYETAPLKNPVNDAKDMADSLKELGFDVVYAENAGEEAMKLAILDFGKKLRKGGVGLFYFAGHGIQVKGRNYLIPVDAKIESESDVEFDGVDAGRVLGKMEDAENNLNIVILDACRNNPFARSFRSETRGLARMDAPKGSFIAYSTAPGSVAEDGEGRNGIYTRHLLKHMKTPGLTVEQIFKEVRKEVIDETHDNQIPWESSSLVGDFYFVIEGKMTVTAAPPQSESAELEKERERLQQEREELERLKIEIEQKKVEAERKRLEEEKVKLEKLANLPSKPEYPSPLLDNHLKIEHGITTFKKAIEIIVEAYKKNDFDILAPLIPDESTFNELLLVIEDKEGHAKAEKERQDIESRGGIEKQINLLREDFMKQFQKTRENVPDDFDWIDAELIEVTEGEFKKDGPFEVTKGSFLIRSKGKIYKFRNTEGCVMLSGFYYCHPKLMTDFEESNESAAAVLRNAATAQEAYYVDHGSYTNRIEEIMGNTYGLIVDAGVTIRILNAGKNNYEMESFHERGDRIYTLKGPGGRIEYSKGKELIDEKKNIKLKKNTTR